MIPLPAKLFEAMQPQQGHYLGYENAPSGLDFSYQEEPHSSDRNGCT
jgi:hypothetical protein